MTIFNTNTSNYANLLKRWLETALNSLRRRIETVKTYPKYYKQMKVICCYCKKTIRYSPGLHNTSDGICVNCFSLGEYKGWDYLLEYTEKFRIGK